MTPYISQPKGSMSCGAYTIAYYLWETNKAKCVNDRAFVNDIYNKIQIRSNDLGIHQACASPKRMIEELCESWSSHSYGCIVPNSPLIPFAQGLHISTENVNVFDALKADKRKYAIILCISGNSINSLHYILIKCENNKFKMLNSSAVYGNGTDNVTWENFSINSHNKIILERDCPYQYTGAAILID